MCKGRKRMLNFGPYLPEVPVDPLIQQVRCAAHWRLAHDAPEAAVFAECGLFLGMDVTLNPPRTDFSSPCRSSFQTRLILGLGGSGLRTVCRIAGRVHTHMAFMGLRPKTLAVAFFGG